MRPAYFALTFCTGCLLACGISDQALQEKVVTLHLNDPKSAVFRGAFKSKTADDVWCGEVNARNRMGGMVGFTRYVVYLPSKKDRVDPERDPQGTIAASQVYFEGNTETSFQGKWSLMCV